MKWISSNETECSVSSHSPVNHAVVVPNLSLSLTSSRRFVLSMLMAGPAPSSPPICLIKNQLKTPPVSRVQSGRGWNRASSRSAPCPPPPLFPPGSLSPTHSEAPPPCLLEVGNMIYENAELHLYFFSLLHPLIYLLDFSCSRPPLPVWGGWMESVSVQTRLVDCRHGADLSHT